MPECSLDHIPKRLHWESKPIIDSYEIDDLIYRRCKQENLINPFATISLREISNNIGTCLKEEISLPYDVLLKTDGDSTHYENQIICTLIIKELTEDNRYYKKYDDEDIICEVILLHDPLCCMYPHCVFRIMVNETMVNQENYDQIFNIKKFKKIRSKIRQDLALMLKREEIKIDFN